MTSLEILRAYLPDADGAVWDDGELRKLLDRARVAYSRDTGVFRRLEPLHVGEDGSGDLPDGCLEVKGAWNAAEDRPLAFATVRGLEHRDPHWRDAEGTPQAILADAAGKYRLYPNPYASQEETPACIVHGVWGSTQNGYGVLWFDMLAEWHKSYGVEAPEDGYGVACAIDFDESEYIWTCGTCWEPAGDLLCTMTGGETEIADYMAVVLFAAHLAYLADTDFVNPPLAQNFLSRYRSRVAALGGIVAGNAKRANGRYY